MKQLLLLVTDWSSVFTWLLFSCALITAALSYKGLFSNTFIPYLQNSDRRDKIIFVISLATLVCTQFKSCSDDNASAIEKKAFKDTLSLREDRYNHNLDSVSNKLNTTQDSLRSVIEHKTDTLRDLQLSIKDSIKVSIDSSYQHSVAASNKALASFGLQLQDSLTRLKLASEEHVLWLAGVETHSRIFFDTLDGIDVIKVQLKAYGGSVYNVTLKYFAFCNANALGISNGNIFYNHIDDTGSVSVNRTIVPENVSTTLLFYNGNMARCNSADIIIKGFYSKTITEPKDPEKFILAFHCDFLNKKYISILPLKWKDFPF